MDLKRKASEIALREQIGKKKSAKNFEKRVYEMCVALAERPTDRTTERSEGGSEATAGSEGGVSEGGGSEGGDVTPRIEEIYATHGYNAMGELAQQPDRKGRAEVLKRILNVSSGWDCYTFATLEREERQRAKQRTRGVEVEKSDYPCRSKNCGSEECYIYQLQTRSCDEAPTTFVVCTDCGNRYRLG